MIAITGATGNTGLKISHLLLDKNKKIRAIGRSGEKLKPLQERGAEIAVGDQGDLSFKEFAQKVFGPAFQRAK